MALRRILAGKPVIFFIVVIQMLEAMRTGAQIGLKAKLAADSDDAAIGRGKQIHPVRPARSPPDIHQTGHQCLTNALALVFRQHRHPLHSLHAPAQIVPRPQAAYPHGQPVPVVHEHHPAAQKLVAGGKQAVKGAQSGLWVEVEARVALDAAPVRRHVWGIKGKRMARWQR